MILLESMLTEHFQGKMKLAAMCAACKEKIDKSYSPVCELTFTSTNSISGTPQPIVGPDDVEDASHLEQPSSDVENTGIDTVDGGGEPPDDTSESRTTERSESPAPAIAEDVAQEISGEFSTQSMLDEHMYSHPMVFYQVTPKVEAAAIPTDRVEEKLGVMHDHIMALQDRMDRLEQLLRQALGIPDITGDSESSPGLRVV